MASSTRRASRSSSRSLARFALAAAVVLPAGLGATAAAAPPAGVGGARSAVLVPAQDPAPVATAGTSTGTSVNPGPGASALPGIGTSAWVLADLDSGEILAMHNPDQPMRPASTLKLLTALTVAPRLSPEQPYRAVADDEKAEGNRVVLYEGLTYTVADLLHAALMPSANDAAEALARANGGIPATVEQMNAEAARLGATRTKAVNPSGLDADGQFTTARDLATIGRAAFANPEIAGYLTLRVTDFPGKLQADGKRTIYPIYSQNRMLSSGFDGALGGKSGFTTLARRTFVGAAERDGRRLVASLMNIGGNTYGTAQVLLNWGLANADRLSPVGRLPEPTAPAPQFDRTIVPLPGSGTAPVTNTKVAEPVSDAPTAVDEPREWRLPDLGSLPNPLVVLTWLAGIIALFRARVYWIQFRNRSAWRQYEARTARSGRASASGDARGGEGAGHAARAGRVPAGRAGAARTDRVGRSAGRRWEIREDPQSGFLPRGNRTGRPLQPGGSDPLAGATAAGSHDGNLVGTPK